MKPAVPQPVPELLGHKGHERMQEHDQLLVDLDGKSDRLSIHLLAGFWLDELEIPVAVVVPEDIPNGC